jgi:hypothetical protein
MYHCWLQNYLNNVLKRPKLKLRFRYIFFELRNIGLTLNKKLG